eukprot:TRINITY_DN3561_c0_g1_i1.p1 TRINITY_DN3561_c0_g1~~TRINITY_DN3561_c0_g1_i1.p1  ORF type:complete len:598 (+),score=100.59 TRINITY_DN3561_c0_g1_i1:107-1900(+)
MEAVTMKQVRRFSSLLFLLTCQLSEGIPARRNEVVPALDVKPRSSAAAKSVAEPKPDDRGQPLVKENTTLDKAGQPHYSDVTNAKWEDFEKGGPLGRSCKAELDDCGKALVCRQGVCAQCRTDKDCPSLAQCVVGANKAKSCVGSTQKAWYSALTNKWEFLCTLMVALCSAMAAAAGTGGGGMFVPLLMTLSLLKDTPVMALSQCMILAGSLVNLSVFLAARHPEYPDQPVIDYDCVVLFEPLLFLGVTFGVLINRMAPSWILVALLVLILGTLLIRTSLKGYTQYHKEKAEKADREKKGIVTPGQTPLVPERAPQGLVRQTSWADSLAGPEDEEVFEVERVSYAQVFAEVTKNKSYQLIGTVSLWLLVLTYSFHGYSSCSSPYYVFLTALTLVLIGFSLYASRNIVGPSSHENPVDWVSSKDGVLKDGEAEGVFQELQKSMKFPFVAFCAGFLGGLLGLGGGMILSPVLIEVGMHSEAVQATTAVFVFLSSSIGVIQFGIMGQIVWHYALWYGSVTLFATIFGQWVCEVFIRRRRRYSLITCAVAAVIMGSLICLLLVGIPSVQADIADGKPLGFTTAELCSAGSQKILAAGLSAA